jgi:hypothetical protein
VISSNGDINEFLEEIGDKEFYDIIVMANKEATEVERIALHSGDITGGKNNCGKDYANNLKELIFFLRYTVKPKKLTDKFGYLSEKVL